MWLHTVYYHLVWLTFGVSQCMPRCRILWSLESITVSKHTIICMQCNLTLLWVDKTKSCFHIDLSIIISWSRVPFDMHVLAIMMGKLEWPKQLEWITCYDIVATIVLTKIRWPWRSVLRVKSHTHSQSSGSKVFSPQSSGSSLNRRS